MSNCNGKTISYRHKFMVMMTVLFACCTANAIEITPPYQESGDILDAKPQKYITPTTVTQNTPLQNNNVAVPPQIASSGTGVMAGERIYYVRSMTSNNPEYKTRFSILHETPSPKRVAGERLYNLSEEQFRLAVNGNNIRVLDTPVFKLTGINSARGRYGELRLTDGGTMQIQGTSNRFRGNWDIDGTGVLKGNVTPTNLVSAEIPASLITYNADGSVRTNEQYIMTFKAMAMGPYNGYWSDGNNMSIWLWGMSKTKTHSREFTYVGLDLGITTTALPKDVTNTIATPVAETPVVATPVTQETQQPYVPAPQTGGFTNGGGGGFFPVPFPIGGGGGGTTVITRPFCQEYPNDPSCKPLCERYPNDPSCKPLCERYPNDPSCKPLCERNPNDPSCKPLCERNPNDPSCKPLCERNPNDPSCKPLCERNPNDPSCKPLCERNPNDPSCKPLCERNPNDPSCKPLCERNPNDPSCKPLCERNPNDPSCKPLCERNPNDPSCKPLCERNPNDPSCLPNCTETPNDPRCKPLCERNPSDPSCLPNCTETPNDPKCLPNCTETPNDPKCLPNCTETPNDPKCLPNCTETPNDPRCLPNCTETPNDPRCLPNCTETPNDPRCLPNCTETPNDPKCLNPVSEPFGTFILFGLFAGYFIRKRKFSK